MNLSELPIRLSLPSVYPVTQKYGDNPQDYNGKWGITEGHNGVDYGSPNGSPFQMAHDGPIDKISWEDGGFGWYIKQRCSFIWNGKEQTFYLYYAHLKGATCMPGQVMTAGQVGGYTDTTGWATGPHLHFGMKIPGMNPKNKDWVNPEPFLNAQPDDLVETSIEPTVVAPLPAIPDGATLDLGGAEFQVISSYLNARNGPGTDGRGFQVVGRFEQDQILKAKRLHLFDAWIETEDGLFGAWIYQGTAYLVKK